MSSIKKKILIADSSTVFLKSLIEHKKADDFFLETASSGSECLEKVKRSSPDLLIVDFMLPQMHGIEILQQFSSTIPVILTGYFTMGQNYHAALALGASYFIEKPCTPATFFHLIALFFEGTLSPPPFANKKPPVHYNKLGHLSTAKASSYIKLWGTRGSNPVAGAEYVRFGGNTPCLEIRNHQDLVIIDAGSGIRGLGHLLHDHPEKNIHILLSHTHWDHLLGFPFFYPIYQSHRNIHIWAPVGFEKSTKDLFHDMLSYSYFPVGLQDIQSSLEFHDLRDGQVLDFGSIKISTHYAFHPGATLCFKIEMKGQTIGYVTDNEFLMGNHLSPLKIDKNSPLVEPYQSLLSFLGPCDILIHEAQYTNEEYMERIGWGHSSLGNVSFLVQKLNIKKWIVTHHDPRHTDEYLLQKYQEHLSLMKDMHHECSLEFAYDGMLIAID